MAKDSLGRETKRMADTSQLEAVLDILGRADANAKRATVRRIGEAARLLLEENGREDLTFAQFKARLGPDLAASIAVQARRVGAQLGREPGRALEAIGFLVVSWALQARADARWISHEDARLVDRLIAVGEQLIERRR